MATVIIDKKTYRFTNTGIAKVLGVHRNTVYLALTHGNGHPQYNRVITAITNKNKVNKSLK